MYREECRSVPAYRAGKVTLSTGLDKHRHACSEQGILRINWATISSQRLPPLGSPVPSRSRPHPRPSPSDNARMCNPLERDILLQDKRMDHGLAALPSERIVNPASAKIQACGAMISHLLDRAAHD